MTRKGGYEIFDFQNFDLTKKPTIPGMYERLESNYGKSVCLINVEYNGFFTGIECITSPEYVDGAFKLFIPSVTGFSTHTRAGYLITVRSNDLVSVLTTNGHVAATVTVPGLVKKCPKVTESSTNLTNSVVFNDLIAKLKTAGIMMDSTHPANEVSEVVSEKITSKEIKKYMEVNKHGS